MPEEWDGYHVKGNKESARTINAWPDTMYARAFTCQQELYSSGKLFTARQVRRLMQGEELEPIHMASTCWDYYLNYVAGLVGKDYSPATLVKYRSAYKAFKTFLRLRRDTDDIRLDHLDHRFIKDYEYFLKTDYNIQNNTAIQHIKRLRSVAKIAIDFGWLQRDPFLAHRMKATEVFRDYLTNEELDRLSRRRFSKRLTIVRDMFLFSCYTGLSYADTVKLETSDVVIENGETWLQTHRVKNNNRVRVPLLAPAQVLLERYKDHPRTLNGRLLPRISNQKANAYLKEIAKTIDLTKNLTYHCARHTFATTITLTNGIPIETVGQMLGHKKLATTQLYARVTDSKVRRDMKELKEKYEQEPLPLSDADELW